MPKLTADLVARAVIAAARSYGDDPIEAMTTAQRGGRRSIVAAVSALEAEGLGGVKRIAGILGVLGTSVHHARKRKYATFVRASGAAIEAIRNTNRPPEARASVLQGTKPTRTVRSVEISPREPRRVVRPKEIAQDDAERLEVAAKARVAAAASKPVVWSEGEASLSGRIRAELARGPVSAPALAHRLDAKELPILDCLRSMAGQGQVRGLEPPAQGARFRKWELVA